MYLDPEQQDDVTIVRALLGWLLDRSAVGAELLHDQGTVYLDGARDRVVFGLPGPATVYVLDTPDLRAALAGAVRAVLGPRFAAYVRDLDANDPAEALPFEERDGWQDVHEEVLAMAQEPQLPAEPPQEEQQRSHRSPFERIRRIAADGSEYWSSRDLAHVLGYVPWSIVFVDTVGSVVTGAIGGWLSKLLLPNKRPPGGGSGERPVDYKDPFEEGRYRPITGSAIEDTERTPVMRMDPAPPNALADDTPGSAIQPGDPPAM